jgi:hypothetical protein
MKHLVVWPKISVDNPDTGESSVLAKDEVLPDYVDDFTRFVLVQTGAVRPVEDSFEAPAASPEPVRLTEHPPLTSDLALAEKDTPAGEAAARLRAEPRKAESKTK